MKVMRLLLPLLALSLMAPSWADDAYITIDGVSISKDQYIKLLERITVDVPEGEKTKAERLALDQLVSNIIILREAEKLGLMPSYEDVERLYLVQKKLMEAQQPGKNFKQELARQGMTVDEFKEDLKVQMAETNLYARKINLTEAEVKAEYQRSKNTIGIPDGSQLRLILLPPNTAQAKKVAQQLASGKPFEEIARTTNEPTLLKTGGEQVLYDSQLPAAVVQKVSVAKPGSLIGPIKWVIPQSEDGPAVALTAWIKVMKRFKGVMLEYADAAPILRRDMVRQKIQKPAYASKRAEILKIKMNAAFESEDPGKDVVWEDIKRAAREQGVKE